MFTCTVMLLHGGFCTEKQINVFPIIEAFHLSKKAKEQANKENAITDPQLHPIPSCIHKV